VPTQEKGGLALYGAAIECSKDGMTGADYRKLIGRYLVNAYGSRGLKVYEEVALGTSIIGKQRRVDLFVTGPNDGVLVIECKYQESLGTADEKLLYALRDMEALRVPGVIAYAGQGFSAGVLHLLQSSELAAYCLPHQELLSSTPRAGTLDSGTWQLDHVLAQTFGLWDIVLQNKVPLAPETQLWLVPQTKDDG
jgi:hypothetical protein